MPFARNSIDGVQTYYEDDGGGGPPVVVYSGLTQTICDSRSWPLAKALAVHARLVFADHRGHGLSDKPQDGSAYASYIRAADFVAVLDDLGLEQAHFLGYSWGARLGFCVGEHQASRAKSLILGGSHPYSYAGDNPRHRAVSEGLASAAERGMRAYVERIESWVGTNLPESVKTEIEANDPKALHTAWSTGTNEGQDATDLSRWRIPCLLYCGDKDESFSDARRAAGDIPSASFLVLPDRDHLSAMRATSAVLPRVLELLKANQPA